MQIFLKVLVSAAILILLLSSLSTYVDPAGMAAQDAFAMSLDGTAGKGAMRGVVGGHMLGIALLCLYGLVKLDSRPLYAAAFLELVTIAGRVLSIGIDGFDARVLGPIGIEIVLATIMFSAAMFLQPSAARSAA